MTARSTLSEPELHDPLYAADTHTAAACLIRVLAV
jgi:hypothetical protein